MTVDFAVDVGGTFTDIVVLDTKTGNVVLDKTPTTPSEPSEGVLNAVAKVGLQLADSKLFFHGTTLGINTILQRKGAKTGLITTKGFRDELEFSRLTWPMYRLHWDRPPALVPRFLRCEVNERLRADGAVLEELDEMELHQVIGHFLHEEVESIAVCFLHAYAFPDHERQVGELIASKYPQLNHTLSHSVTQEYREFERTATTVVDAMIKPIMASYIASLESSVRKKGFTGELLLTRGDGGVMSAAEATERSVRTLLSGPASGVMGAVTLGRWLGMENIVAIDMGGTSFDAALIIGHEPTFRPVARVDSVPLLMPVIDIESIGAGGGSIARLDSGGALEVGPESAGAVPGPICYGRGGTEPTFTDAAVVSGLIDVDYFLGGEITLDALAARQGIEAKIARPLGLSVDDAAAGIVTLTEAKMAATLEEITIGKGYDPRDFRLLAYGGCGPLVASALATQLAISSIIVPKSPGTFSAWGMLTLDIVHDFSKTSVGKLEQLDEPQILDLFRELEDRAARALDREGIPPARRYVIRSIDMRYENQEHTLNLRLGSNRFEDLSAEFFNGDHLRHLFYTRHKDTYGYAVSDPMEIVSYRVRAVGTLTKPKPPTLPAKTSQSDQALKGRRRAFHRESGGEFEWLIYERNLLKPGNEIRGPAIVEESAATTLVAPQQLLTVDSMGNLVVNRQG